MSTTRFDFDAYDALMTRLSKCLRNTKNHQERLGVMMLVLEEKKKKKVRFSFPAEIRTFSSDSPIVSQPHIQQITPPHTDPLLVPSTPPVLRCPDGRKYCGHHWGVKRACVDPKFKCTSSLETFKLQKDAFSAKPWSVSCEAGGTGEPCGEPEEKRSRPVSESIHPASIVTPPFDPMRIVSEPVVVPDPAPSSPHMAVVSSKPSVPVASDPILSPWSDPRMSVVSSKPSVPVAIVSSRRKTAPKAQLWLMPGYPQDPQELKQAQRPVFLGGSRPLREVSGSRRRRIIIGGAGPSRVPARPIEEFLAVIRVECGVFKNWKYKLPLRKLGEGQAGSVYVLCRFVGDNCEFVLKMQSVATSYDKKVFQTEVNTLKKLRGTNIGSTIYDAWTCGDKGYIVLEKLDKTIHTIKAEIQKGSMSRDILTELYPRIVQKLEDLHAKNIVVRDLHGGNIMVTKLKRTRDGLLIGDIKFIDFGMAYDFTGKPANFKIGRVMPVGRDLRPRAEYGDRTNMYTFKTASRMDSVLLAYTVSPRNSPSRKKALELLGTPQNGFWMR